MTQQKQRKQLHLTDNKNIFTYCFQSVQRLQPNSKIYHKKFHVYQAQRIQPKIRDIHTATATYTTQFYQSYIGNNKPNKHNPNNQNNEISVGFTTNTKFVLLELRKRKFWSNSYSNYNQFQKIHIQTISYILSITNLYISSIPKNL